MAGRRPALVPGGAADAVRPVALAAPAFAGDLFEPALRARRDGARGVAAAAARLARGATHGGSPRARSPPSRSSSARPRCCPSRRSATAPQAGGWPAAGGPAQPDLPARRVPLPPSRASRPRPVRVERDAAPSAATELAVGLGGTRATSVGPPVRGAPRATARSCPFRARLGHVGSRHGPHPEPARRLYGNERRSGRSSRYRRLPLRAPSAPRVVIGDISRRGGGPMDQHASHQNGLDVDVYYPRRDGHLSAPIATSQIDHLLAQDLLDRFVAAGAHMVFVGYSAGLQARRRRRSVPEPREPHARPLPAPPAEPTSATAVASVHDSIRAATTDGRSLA